MQFLSQEGNDRSFSFIIALSLIFLLNNRQRRNLFAGGPPVLDLPQNGEDITDKNAEVFYDEGVKEEAYEILEAEPADNAIPVMEAGIYGYPAEREENLLQQEVEEA